MLYKFFSFNSFAETDAEQAPPPALSGLWQTLSLLRASLKPGKADSQQRRSQAQHCACFVSRRGAPSCLDRLRRQREARPLGPAGGGGLGRLSGWWAGESAGTSGGKTCFLPADERGGGLVGAPWPLSERSLISSLKDIWGRGQRGGWPLRKLDTFL